MRYAVLLLALPALSAMGCSALVADAGKDLSHLESREEVRKQFGEPVATGTTHSDLQFEDFHSRRKYAERCRAVNHFTGSVWTFGLAELYLLPRELYLLGKRGIFGQDVRVIYNADGTVHNIQIDGYAIWLCVKPIKTNRSVESEE